MLDNKVINEVTRSFLKSFHRVKSEQKQKQPNISSNDHNNIDIDLREELPSTPLDGAVFDVSKIICQAIVENVESKPFCCKKWKTHFLFQ